MVARREIKGQIRLQLQYSVATPARKSATVELKTPSTGGSSTTKSPAYSPNELVEIVRSGAQRALEQSVSSFEPTDLVADVGCEVLEKVWDRFKLSGVRVRLLEGTVQIYEIPLQPHELVAGVFDTEFVGYNMRITGMLKNPMAPLRSSRVSAGHDTLLEPDCSYINRRVQGGGDLDPVTNSTRPSVVVEVGLSEPFASMVSTANVYLRHCPSVRVVISVKLWRASEAVGLMANQLVCMVHYRADVVEGVSPTPPRHLISFGEGLHPSSRRSVLARSGAPLANCEGVGFDGPPCTQPGILEYQLRIDGAELWHNVPPDQQPATGTPDLTIDLFTSVIQELRAFHYVP